MAALRALMGDRKRAQRGSVLSGVLIITAFLAIIAGALMTELSTNFLLSRVLINRVSTEATVNSSMELAIAQLQKTAITPQASSCPSMAPASANLNGQTAVVGYQSCELDASAPAQFLTPPSGFTVDGAHVVMPGEDEYVVGGSSGIVYRYSLGSGATLSSFPAGSAITGPPFAMPDLLDPPGITNLVPVSSPQGVAMFRESSAGSTPVFGCNMPANGNVTAQPAAGVNITDAAYFGDSSGTLWAYDASEDGSCGVLDSAPTSPAGMSIVAGPIVFAGSRPNVDEIFVVAADGSSSYLLAYTYTSGRFGGLQPDPNSSLKLVASNASGLDLEKTGPFPVRLAVTFAGGTVEVVQITGGFNVSKLATATVPVGIDDAPNWCTCPSGAQIGVGSRNGRLYLFDANLNLITSYAGGAAISTTPIVDQAGDWFFAANDGNLYAARAAPASAAVGTIPGSVGSSPLLGDCPSGSGICIYMGQSNGSAYRIELDSRDVTLTACIGALPVNCSGTNPRLWAQAQVMAISPFTVQVTGWSYYSP
jgi:hypothetical protein